MAPTGKKKTAIEKIPKQILTPEVRLERLYKRIAADPDLRHLQYQRRLVTGHGVIRPKVMVIVEMPDIHDEHMGVVMTGPGGVVLHEMLSAIELKRSSHCFFTPVMKYRTQAGRDATFREVAMMLPYLQEEIRIVQPEILVTCGRFVNNLFFPGRQLREIRGTKLFWKGYITFPTLNPQAVLADPTNRPLMLETFRMIGDLL